MGRGSLKARIRRLERSPELKRAFRVLFVEEDEAEGTFEWKERRGAKLIAEGTGPVDEAAWQKKHPDGLVLHLKYIEY